MMKKLIITIVAFLLLPGVAMPSFLNHPNFAKINTFTASIVQTISDSQADFFTVNGRYFQGLWLLGDVQVDGTADYTANNATAPSDFPFTWKDFNPVVFKNNLKIPVNVCIDVYESPDGWGWQFTAVVYYEGLGPDAYGNDGNRWIYMHHEGPEEKVGVYDEWYILPEM